MQPYTEALGRGAQGLRIALVKEGFGLPNSEPDVDAKVRKAGELLGKLGAKVTEVSIPWHMLAGALWLPIGVEGLTQTMMWGDGYGLSRPDLYVTSLMDFHRGWRRRANELSETTKLFTLLGTYIHKLPKPGASREEVVQRALEMIANTAPFDISHHPAMAIPCGMTDGLPVSMMLVAKHWDEPTIYRAAAAFEGAGDWKSM